MDLVISAVAAVVAGLCLAGAGVLQQRAAAHRPSSERMSVRLITDLVRNRTWLSGIGLAALSYGFQAVALTFGPLTLVQPLVVSELLFAVPVSVRLRGLRLRARDWAAVGLVIAGLTVGIVAAAKVLEGPVKASAFALAGSVVMGFQSALYNTTIALLRKDLAGVFLHWETYVLVIASIAGTFLIQNAFQAGPLAASTPVIDATLPLLAVALGVWLFGERVRTTPLGLGGAALGVVLLVTGIVLLDRSPVVRKEQRIEQEEQEKTAREEAGQQA